MNNRPWLLILCSFASACLIVAACSDDESSKLSGGDTGTGASAAGGRGGGISAGGSLGVGAGTPCESTCSSDLKKVIGCMGDVLETCPGDQACLSGACTNDPCGAAEASKSSYGCDYWAVRPDLISAGDGACFAAYVANTWSDAVHIDLFLNNQPVTGNFIHIPQGQGQGLTYVPYDANTGLAPGDVAIVFLTHDDPGSSLPVCPFPAAVNINSQADPGIAGTGIGTAFNIRTDRPIVAYSILPYGGGPSAATSASLLLPTSAWDDNYIAINAFEKSQIVAQAQPSLDILAHVDNTTVTILPKVPIVAGNGVAAAPANAAATYTLNRGQYLQISQDQELTGSVIQADQSIGVWGGASCLNVPVSASACDSAHQQIPPVKALGTRYAMVRHRNRTGAPVEESPPWRVVGAVDGTQLSWLPVAPPGAPSTLNQGDVFQFDASGPYYVQSQDDDHPYYVAQYMTGASMAGGEGDPEWVNVIPTDQYLDSYVFFTDPTYSETSLVVTRRRSTQTSMFADVTLDCAGVLTGWAPLGNDLEYTRIDLVTGNFQSVNGCENGRHEMSSDTPFGVTVWGWGSSASSLPTTYVSYAYPAGASVQPINEVVVPPTPK
jgi:hypothetical protein